VNKINISTDSSSQPFMIAVLDFFRRNWLGVAI
jgi:hypothetical protein